MGKHLSKYSSEADYNNNKDNHVKPHISLITGSPKKMKYEKKILLNLITFYIGNAEYQAEDGMTWDDWVNSIYNSDQSIIPYERVQGKIYVVKYITNNTQLYLYNSDDKLVYIDDVINNINYTFGAW